MIWRSITDMLKSEQIQHQIDILMNSLSDLKTQLNIAKIEEEKEFWYKKQQTHRIPCASRPDNDWLEVQDSSPQEHITNVEKAIVYITTHDSTQGGHDVSNTVTSHLNLEGVIELRDFLNKRIDYHGKL